MHSLTLLAGMIGTLPQGSPSASRPSVVLITLDTTRRDAMGFHGAVPSPTPVLDALAEEATVFEDAYSVAPLTLPAHASLMSGLYPARHGVRSNSIYRLAPAATTLAEVLQAQGYATRAAVSSYVLSPGFGLDQGFEHYRAPGTQPGESKFLVVDQPANETVDLALLDLGEMPAPFFYWLHLFDPHFPYAPPAELQPRELPRDPVARDRALYLAEIRHMDQQLGRLREFVRTHVRGPVIWVVTADHGESLGDGREPTHGNYILDPTMRVPLLLRIPDGEAQRLQGPVSLVDVMPTLLGLLGIPAPDLPLDGQDLSGAVRQGRDLPDRGLALESYYLWLNHGWAPYEGVVNGAFKYIHSRVDELYDRHRDPAERANLLTVSGDMPPALTALSQRLEQLFSIAPAFEAPSGGLSELEAQQLEQLGYVAGNAAGRSGRPDFATLPDAAEKAALLQQLEEVYRRRMLQDEVGALELLRQLARSDPDSATVHQLLGQSLMRLAEPPLDEAYLHLHRATELQEFHAVTQFWLGRCLLAMAQQKYQQVLLSMQQQGRAPADWVREEQDLRRRALAAFTLSCEREPQRIETRLHIAALEQVLGERAALAGRTAMARRRYEAALQQLEHALASLAPDNAFHADAERRQRELLAALAALPR